MPLETMMWVQVHNIPICYMNRETTEDICEAATKVIRSQGETDLSGGGFIRVRVKIDVTLPLCCGRVVTMENRGCSWVSFKYERLPNLCYWCGCLTHDDKDYKEWIQSDSTLDPKKKKYDSSIGALLVFPSNRNLVHVFRYYEDLKKNAMKPGSAMGGKTPKVMHQTSTSVPMRT